MNRKVDDDMNLSGPNDVIILLKTNGKEYELLHEDYQNIPKEFVAHVDLYYSNNARVLLNLNELPIGTKMTHQTLCPTDTLALSLSKLSIEHSRYPDIDSLEERLRQIGIKTHEEVRRAQIAAVIRHRTPEPGLATKMLRSKSSLTSFVSALHPNPSFVPKLYLDHATAPSERGDFLALTVFLLANPGLCTTELREQVAIRWLNGELEVECTHLAAISDREAIELEEHLQSMIEGAARRNKKRMRNAYTDLLINLSENGRRMQTPKIPKNQPNGADWNH